jgi:hypothetical protein
MTIKDISYKFGILPARAKAIIFMEYTYWNEIYPKMGETYFRMGLEMEATYATFFPFVDYGVDLD